MEFSKLQSGKQPVAFYTVRRRADTTVSNTQGITADGRLVLGLQLVRVQ